ncbi:MAG: hypothetical protein RL090_1737 [Bacteroidota bacterium]|jgi:hypothetical protein
MKKTLLSLIAVSLMAFSSCRKSDDLPTDLDGNFIQHNADRSFQQDESDQADADINDALKDIPGFGKTAGVSSTGPLCGVTIDSSQLAQKILFFNFDGVTPCFSPSRTRSGQIKVQLTSGNNWSDINSVLTLTYINFKVTRLSDNRWVMFNGVKTLTNLNGHDWLGFLAGNSTHQYKERAYNVDVDFINGASAIWNIARRTTWSFSPTSNVGPKINFECTGDTSLNGFSNVDMWGVNRFGESFTTYYTAPWRSNSYCGFWRPVGGTLQHKVAGRQYRLDLGVDQSGNPSALNCAYGFKVTWTINGNTNSRVFSY